VLFAYEEAIGFMPGAMYRDKDGIAAAVALCEAAAHLYEQGSSLWQQLDSLYARYGRPEYRSGYFVSDAPAKTAAVFDRLRAAPPSELAGLRVDWLRDLGTGEDSSQPGGRAALPWRRGDLMISYGLGGGVGVLTLRASGTEPKLKWYLEVLLRSPGASGVSASAGPACAVADQLVAAVDEQLVRVDEAGLTRPKRT
jgi:phosphomannomutase